MAVPKFPACKSYCGSECRGEKKGKKVRGGIVLGVLIKPFCDGIALSERRARPDVCGLKGKPEIMSKRNIYPKKAKGPKRFKNSSKSRND